MLKQIFVNARSCRRFRQNEEVSMEVLRLLVDLARLCPSGGNLQPLRFIISAHAPKNELIFPALGWGSLLKGWDGPAEGERPAAYVVILGDTAVSKSFGQDPGIAAHAICLGAAERNLGGCIIGSIKGSVLRKTLGIPDRYKILLVVALGKPAETAVIEGGDVGRTAYWRDDQGLHHVPKLSLEDLILDFPTPGSAG